jgi:hypothetical protein
MDNTYEYLKKFLPPHPKFEGTNRNWFCPIKSEEIVGVEEIMGLHFPSELREFYNQIGYGMLRSPHKIEEEYEFYNNNEILPPAEVAKFYQLVTAHHQKDENERTSLKVLLNLSKFYTTYEDHTISIDGLESLQPGDLPFFEIGDSFRFLITKPHSNNPNAVWAPSNIKIEDSIEKFIWRLYYESPSFYDDIIEKHYRENA